MGTHPGAFLVFSPPCREMRALCLLRIACPTSPLTTRQLSAWSLRRFSHSTNVNFWLILTADLHRVAVPCLSTSDAPGSGIISLYARAESIIISRGNHLLGCLFCGGNEGREQNAPVAYLLLSHLFIDILKVKKYLLQVFAKTPVLTRRSARIR